jgi:hypothetical protein
MAAGHDALWEHASVPEDDAGTSPSVDGFGQDSATEAVRERFLRQALIDLEAGALDAPAYTEKVAGLESAGSIDELMALAAGTVPASRPSSLLRTGAPPAVPGGPNPAHAGALDPVDLARLAAGPQRSRPALRVRYTSLVLVVVLFALLLVAGIWLAAQVHTTHP